MTKTTFGSELIASMEEALAHARGEKTAVKLTPAVEVKRIRKKVGFTQDQFATALGVSKSGLRKWEQNVRAPRGAARTLLKIMDREPDAVARALTSDIKRSRPTRTAPLAKAQTARAR